MNEKIRKYLPVYLRVCRGGVLYVCFLLLWLLASLCLNDAMLRGGDSLGDHFLLRIPYIVRSCIVPFFFFSIARVFAENDPLTALLCAKEQRSFLQNAAAVLSCPLYWVELGTVFGLVLLLPYECGYMHVATALVGGRGWTRLQTKLLVLAIALPGVLLLHLWARLSAMQKQDDSLCASGVTAAAGEGGAPDYLMLTSRHAVTGTVKEVPQGNHAEFETFHRRFGISRSRVLRLVRGVALLFPIYMIGMFGLSLFFPIFLSFFFVLLTLRNVRWWLPPTLILGAIAAFWLYYLLRAIRIRRRFIKRLKKTCREYGFTHSKMKRPYRSLLRLGDEINFTIFANGKEYDCKFFAGLRRNCPLYFSEKGVLYCQHSFRFRRVEFFRYTTAYHFDFESTRPKICIVAPVPKVIGAGNDRWNRPIDTGMAVGGYRIFSSTGLINALVRDCVERD